MTHRGHRVTECFGAFSPATGVSVVKGVSLDGCLLNKDVNCETFDFDFFYDKAALPMLSNKALVSCPKMRKKIHPLLFVENAYRSLSPVRSQRAEVPLLG